MVGRKDLNEKGEEKDFSLKGLNEKRVAWILICYYSLADKNFLWTCWDNFRKNSSYEDKKKLSTQIFEEKVNYLEKLL